MANKFYRLVGKRLLDLLISGFALLLLSPVILCIAIAVRVNLGSPVFFLQVRPGFKENEFGLFKFRSMTNARDEAGNLLPDRDRITKFGAVLRKSSLDELPELINIFKGEMSLVGPRPLLKRYQPFYSDTERLRFNVLPGLTGYAQINGRNSVSWDERLAHDVWYVKNMSLMLDLKILLRTAQLVVKRDGIVVVPDTAMLSLDEERSSNDID